MDITPGYEPLYRQLEQERQEAEPSLRFMLLDHVEHLLRTRQRLPPIPLAEAERSAAIHTLRQRLLSGLGLCPFPRRTSLQARCVGQHRRDVLTQYLRNKL